MNLVTVKNYRCFREEQIARLAPLTILVGENSTGKTSFLAMVRALWQVAIESRVPDFQEPPYDLGTFGEIAYNRARGGAQSFEAGFTRARNRAGRLSQSGNESINFGVTFERRDGVPYPVMRRLSDEQRSIELTQDGIRLSISDREAWLEMPSFRRPDDNQLVPFFVAVRRQWLEASSDSPMGDKPINPLVDGDMEQFVQFANGLERRHSAHGGRHYPFAGAPVRSTPRRTYDPTRPFQDPGGEYIPTLLVNISRRDQPEWIRLKGALEKFGDDSGLFEEISIEPLGKAEGSPFQLHVRKSGKRSKGSPKGRKRNLIDVGYGVSQALPILTELLRKDLNSMFLLQQPEVHLHPTAQAALGSLFCDIARWDRQIMVETHSDYLLDRVRMDVRDRRTKLQASDVSILYFEPVGLDVRIHSLELDEDGNVANAPPGYRQFFMDEMRRSIGL